MKVVMTVTQQVMAAVMKRAEVMHIAEMAARPVSGIEMMANAAGRNVSRAERMWRRVRHASSEVPAAAEHARGVANAEMRRRNVANTRTAHNAVSRTAMNDSWMTSAKVSAANDVTPTVSRASNVRASDMAAANVTSTDTSAAYVPARMPAPGVTAMPSSTMPTAMLRIKGTRGREADARAQQDCEPDC